MAVLAHRLYATNFFDNAGKHGFLGGMQLRLKSR
jgi:hypothetical protein